LARRQAGKQMRRETKGRATQSTGLLTYNGTVNLSLAKLLRETWMPIDSFCPYTK
jgi:hypothetical protein